MKNKAKRDRIEIAFLTKQMNSAATEASYYKGIVEEFIKLAVEHEIPIDEVYSSAEGDHSLNNHIDRCYRRYISVN